MTDIEIPDNEEAACDLDKIEAHFVSRGRYPDAEFVAGAARRLRADAEEIARLRERIEDGLCPASLLESSGKWHYFATEYPEDGAIGPFESMRLAIEDGEKGGHTFSDWLEAKCAEQQRALEWYSVGHCEKHEARIAELEAALATAQTEAAAQRELATLLERESSDPLTRIAAALERPSREWVAALALVGAARDCPTYESTAISAFKFADALLAEMGEG